MKNRYFIMIFFDVIQIELEKNKNLYNTFLTLKKINLLLVSPDLQFILSNAGKKKNTYI